MFDVTIGSETYVVSFRREERVTACSITGRDGSWVSATRCSESDVFCKNTGRKLAMTRALSCGWAKADRGKFWAAYWAKRHGKKT